MTDSRAKYFNSGLFYMANQVQALTQSNCIKVTVKNPKAKGSTNDDTESNTSRGSPLDLAR